MVSALPAAQLLVLSSQTPYSACRQFFAPQSPLTLAALRVAPNVGVLRDGVVLARLVGACSTWGRGRRSVQGL